MEPLARGMPTLRQPLDPRRWTLRRLPDECQLEQSVKQFQQTQRPRLVSRRTLKQRLEQGLHQQFLGAQTGQLQWKRLFLRDK